MPLCCYAGLKQHARTGFHQPQLRRSTSWWRGRPRSCPGGRALCTRRSLYHVLLALEGDRDALMLDGEDVRFCV